MKKEIPEIKRKVNEPKSVHTGDLERAIERIQQEYGNDLQAFFRDAKESILKRNAQHNKRKTFVL